MDERDYAESTKSEGRGLVGATLAKRDAPIHEKLDGLEKAIANLGERTQIYLVTTESVRRISPTAETERGDVDKPHQSDLTHRLDSFISQVNSLAYKIESAQQELEL